ncbi:MAG: hypothetical protein RIK87_24735 [Fuerstiella sp.]
MIQAIEHSDHNAIPLSPDRPRFNSADDWLSHFEHATKHGHRPWPPVSRDELLTADEHGLLEIHPEWVPCRMGLRLLKLPDCFGRTLEPYGEGFKERFLSTLNTDPQFASAVLNLIRGEG